MTRLSLRQQRQHVGVERQPARAFERDDSADATSTPATTIERAGDATNATMAAITSEPTQCIVCYIHRLDPMNVLLLRPVPGNERFGLGPFFRIEPLGMEYIAAALEARGHRVTLADLRFSRSLAAQMRTARPALVGIAAMHALETDEVARARAAGARAVADVPIVVGGHTAAAYPGAVSRRRASTRSCSTMASARCRASATRSSAARR